MGSQSHKAHPALVLFALSVGAFAIGTTEFASMSLLPFFARDLHIDLPTADAAPRVAAIEPVAEPVASTPKPFVVPDPAEFPVIPDLDAPLAGHVLAMVFEKNSTRTRFSFEMGDTRYLDHVLNQVRRIDGVYDVYRTSGHRPVNS